MEVLYILLLSARPLRPTFDFYFSLFCVLFFSFSRGPLVWWVYIKTGRDTPHFGGSNPKKTLRRRERDPTARPVGGFNKIQGHQSRTPSLEIMLVLFCGLFISFVRSPTFNFRGLIKQGFVQLICGCGSKIGTPNGPW